MSESKTADQTRAGVRGPAAGVRGPAAGSDATVGIDATAAAEVVDRSARGEELRPVVCRGVRGATTVAADDRDEILLATRQMLALLIRRNQIELTDLASAVFTVTKDLTSEFPALAARQLGWLEVPLMCGYEISVPGSLSKCIRVLLHWNTTALQSEIQHVYLHQAEKLRPDLNHLPPVDFDELERWMSEQMNS